MSRDRFTKTESGDTRWNNRTDFGYCDNGFRLQCREEREVYNALKAEGYTVRKHGWPDFTVTREDEVRVIEVKSQFDKLTVSQEHVFRALQQLGVSVEIQKVLNPNRVLAQNILKAERKVKARGRRKEAGPVRCGIT